MKKIAFVALLTGLGYTASAQGLEIGLKVSPGIAFNRVVTTKSKIPFESDGAKAKIGFGIVADYFFGENYAFSTGVGYISKGGSIKRSAQTIDTGGGTFTLDAYSYDQSLQYVEVPVTIKLFTNEVAADTRIYFQLGASLNTLVGAQVDGEKLADADNELYIEEGKRFTKAFNTFEVGAILGSGVELQLGENTKVFGGLSYQHGISDIDNVIEETYDEEFGQKSTFAMKNSLLSLDLGLKF
jgi:hypothetical protein